MWIALGLLAVSTEAHAKPKKDNTAMKAADQHFKNGIRLADEESYEKALAEFEEAYALAPHPLVLFNIAGAHRALKHYREALDTYGRFLLEGDGVVNAELLARGKSDMEALLSLLGRVLFDSRPSGATILVDGEELGLTPIMERLLLAPGAHEVEARLEGHETQTRTLRISAGDELKVTLELVSLHPEVAATTEPAAVMGATPKRLGDRAALSLSAAVGTNTLNISTTGAPTLGVAYALNSRVSLGVDAVLVAYSAIPQLRLRLVGETLSMHVIAAAPLSLSTGANSEFFAAVAGGAGIRYALHDRIGLRLEALLSYAGSERGVTLPAFAGAEVFF